MFTAYIPGFLSLNWGTNAFFFFFGQKKTRPILVAIFSFIFPRFCLKMAKYAVFFAFKRQKVGRRRGLRCMCIYIYTHIHIHTPVLMLQSECRSHPIVQKNSVNSLSKFALILKLEQTSLFIFSQVYHAV